MKPIIAALRAHLAGSRNRPPDGSAPIWNAFMQLSGARTFNAVGPNPISFTEIEAHCRLMRLPLEPRHIEVVLAMDQAWLDHAYAKTRRAPDGVKTLPPVSKQPLSAALFDAMFR